MKRVDLETEKIDAERPHEFVKGVIPGKCNLAFCGELRDAAVHLCRETFGTLVCVKPFNHEGDHQSGYAGEVDATVHRVPQFGNAKGKIEMSSDFAAPDFVEVHQTPEPQYVADCACHEYASCTLDECGVGLYHHKGCQFAPPNQHAAPPRIWIQRYDKYLDHGYYYTAPDGGGEKVEYLAAAPIQAALEACEVNQMGQFNDYIHVCKSDWEALVKSVKGEK